MKSIDKRGALDDRRDDAEQQEGKGSQQADVPFALGLTFGDLGEGGSAAELDVVDPPYSPFPGSMYTEKLTWRRRPIHCPCSATMKRKARLP
ncbi:MAG: hypothetical protein WBF43_10570 [Methylocella sp.]